MRANFSMTCTAVYNTHLDIPNELIIRDEDGKITKESQNTIADYIQEHLGECNVESSLEWIADDDEFGGDVVLSDDDEGNEEKFFVDYP